MIYVLEIRHKNIFVSSLVVFCNPDLGVEAYLRHLIEWEPDLRALSDSIALAIIDQELRQIFQLTVATV